LDQTLNEIRRANDGVRWLFSGHTHHQIYKQSHLINFVNPGAVEDSFDGYEFAVINTGNGEIVFGRIPKTNPIRPTFSVGVISDSLDISKMDPTFWQKLTEEFKKRGVNHIIHCGNISLNDIGRPEFAGFQVFYNLRPDQNNERSFGNWHQIPIETPVVEIGGYKFYVELDLGAALLGKSEIDMEVLCLDLRRKHPEISFVLCGFTNNAFLEEGQEVRIINPGDILKDRNFTVICLPRTEITFGHVPVDPLP
jgi:predicted phosphodiesterase